MHPFSYTHISCLSRATIFSLGTDHLAMSKPKLRSHSDWAHHPTTSTSQIPSQTAFCWNWPFCPPMIVQIHGLIRSNDCIESRRQRCSKSFTVGAVPCVSCLELVSWEGGQVRSQRRQQKTHSMCVVKLPNRYHTHSHLVSCSIAYNILLTAERQRKEHAVKSFSQRSVLSRCIITSLIVLLFLSLFLPL